ncbi:hypothetical protein [Inquilinus sp. CA228]|uniref:hypothetical protein n=1 Tax=Inquilinus sp. CA228 TaxID=3455609 RepID=UPI003F8D53D2
MIGDTLKGLAAWLKALLPALLGYLAGQARAKEQQARSDADTLAEQNDIGAGAPVGRRRILDWMRGR